MKDRRKKGQKWKKDDANDEIVDERFKAALNRPQFRSQKREDNKVVLDERFASVLSDPRFSVQGKDKYGRKQKKKGKQSAADKEELEAFYILEKDKQKDTDGGDDGEEDGESDDNEEEEVTNKEQEKEEDPQDEDPASRIAYLTALSRGELDVSSSSDDDDDSSDDESDDNSDASGEDSVYGARGILDPSTKEEIDEVSLTEVPSPYLAVMNMDWEKVRAIDLFAILTSFTPPGAIKKVQVYPSDFGMERMSKERLEGPTNVWKRKKEKKNVMEDDSSDSKSDDEDDDDEQNLPKIKFEFDKVDSDYDPEKLRAYEVSKLKYYFAVVEFASPEHTDIAYKEIDGMELEHSSAAVDLRLIDPEQLPTVVQNRKLRDEATSLPSNYDPPVFVINALQQTNIECTWDCGDMNRDAKLTGYTTGEIGKWQKMAEGDDLKVYLASDNSTDEDDSDDESNEGTKKSRKAQNMRKLLGLNSEDDDSRGEASSDGEASGVGEKEFKFVPGQLSLQEKIQNKLQKKTDEPVSLTPWEKYQEKRRQKRRERRQASRSKRQHDPDSEDSPDETDEFFVEGDEKQKISVKTKEKKSSLEKEDAEPKKNPSSKEELELILAGDKDEEDAKDYDMRALVRIDKNKGKKLKGPRKRKEESLAANIAGGDFRVDTRDRRFAAVLDGTDSRFGIDRTDPNYKETEAMREIIEEQTKRRKARKKQKIAPNVATTGGGGGAAAADLSSLVQSLKAKVAAKKKTS